MNCIINCYGHNELSVYNGLTFPIVGHCNGHIEVDINGIINDIHPDEILIIDIDREFTHAKYRCEKLGFDYWYNVLFAYIKSLKIKFAVKEMPKEKQADIDNSTTFVEQEDNHDIFNDNQ